MKGLFEATLLKTSLILDPFQVIVAVNKAVHQQKINKMMTKTVHSEILFSLSPRKNISNAFKTFGMGDKDTSVFVAILNDHDKSTMSVIQNLIKGRQVDPYQVSELTNLQSIKEVYNLSETELSVSNTLDAVVSRIASKDIVQV
ncbi:hypothetical protein FSP39_006746 [Pinctada imbricata]|uniref:Uncharacterized protein n=1 Tax=Pinctada imbricata TaxID=66713 RepID=A0AA88YQ67_PINIB|nr:hypothetical protein FSP39_006746 [Pinctada imbricata]